jgi:hypothetical protein
MANQENPNLQVQYSQQDKHMRMVLQEYFQKDKLCRLIYENFSK